METYKRGRLRRRRHRLRVRAGQPVRLVEGVLRGLHFQIEHPQSSSCARRGAVFDVAVDLREAVPPSASGRRCTVGRESPATVQSRGFAHGFLVLSDQAVFCYKCDDDVPPRR